MHGDDEVHDDSNDGDEYHVNVIHNNVICVIIDHVWYDDMIHSSF